VRSHRFSCSVVADRHSYFTSKSDRAEFIKPGDDLRRLLIDGPGENRCSLNAYVPYFIQMTLRFVTMLFQVKAAVGNCGSRLAVVVDRRTLLYGYRRILPMYGVDYMLNIHRVNEGCTNDVKIWTRRRHFLVAQQHFLEPEFRSGPSTSDVVERVHFILPLAGRHETFRRFMDNFEITFLARDGDTVALAIVLFYEARQTDQITERIATTRSRFPNADIRLELMSGNFTRGGGLQRGAALFERDALLVFIDVDFRIHHDVLRRVRLNTIKGRQVYYPIVYSEYNTRWTADVAAASGIELNSSNVFDSNIGYWRRSGYGILAVYNGDFINAGGFDLNIRGWGFEDVQLVEAFIARNMSVFRAPDVGLVHVFHETVCDANVLAKRQYKMCLGVRQSTLASAKVLASYVRATREIYRRNVTKINTLLNTR
jgi:chondroitin sulfate synthase